MPIEFALIQFGQTSQGFEVGPFEHKSAFAIILAVEVFPEPLNPEKDKHVIIYLNLKLKIKFEKLYFVQLNPQIFEVCILKAKTLSSNFLYSYFTFPNFNIIIF